MTEPNMEWEECSNKDGLCIPEDGLHFVECELYRMKRPESSLRKKWDEGIRPCSFDEVENFMSMAISEAEIHGFCNAQNGYAEVVKKLSDDVEKAEQRGYEKGAAEERRRIVGAVEKIRFRFEPPYQGQKDEVMERFWKYQVETLNEVLSIIHDNK